MMLRIEKGQSSAIASTLPAALKICKSALQLTALRYLRHVFCLRRSGSLSTIFSFKRFTQARRVRPSAKSAARELVLRGSTRKSPGARPRLTQILSFATTRCQSRRSLGTALPRIARGNAGSRGFTLT